MAVLGLSVVTESALLRWYALVGIVGGLLFALWRERTVAMAG
jgi:hypothetical protein